MARIALLLLLLLAPWAGEAQEPPGDDAGWRADSLLLADLRLPSSEGPCGAGVDGPFRLPPRPDYPALGLRFADGRQARYDSLLVVGGTRYWALERACAALGANLRWDPAFFRGELTVDTLSCRFVAGGEIVHFGNEAIQLPAPILYVGERLLLPLAFLPHAISRLLGDRMAFEPDELILTQRPTADRVIIPSTRQVGRRTYFTWMLPERGQAQLRGDGAHGLIVDIPGAEIDPLAPPGFEARPAACLRAVRPYRGGVEYILEVAAETRAWRIQWPEDSTSLRVTLSSNQGDLVYRTYHPWQATPSLGISPDSVRVILVLPRPWGADAAVAAERDPRCLVTDLVRQIGYRLQEVLQEQAIHVTILEDTGNQTWTAPANSRGGDLCLCFQPDCCGDVLLPGWRIVTPAARSGERDTYWLGAANNESESDELPPLRDWARIDADYLARAADFAFLMRIYLETEFPALRITAPHWPAQPFEGLAMPAALVYVGDFNDAATSSNLEMALLARRAAGALAGSIRTYFRMMIDG